MTAVEKLSSVLRRLPAVVPGELESLAAQPDLSSVQAGAVLALGLHIDPSLAAKLPGQWKGKFPEIPNLFKANQDGFELVQRAASSLFSSDSEIWTEVAKATVSSRLAPPQIAYFLMTVYLRGMGRSSVVALSGAMRDTGRIYDYRDVVRPRRLVRRYPTGALSEKVALILPSLLVAAAEHWPVASNFLVARSLGFTGGTWDKLSSIPGFRFPSPGEETEQLLRDLSVAMCVTNSDAAPCDRIFYQVRSVTATVDSPALITSSIASKQGAYPCDHLLLDVRVGPGAFIKHSAAAEELAEHLKTILGGWGIEMSAVYTAANAPNGTAIGNAAEVAEAIAIITRTTFGWSDKLLEQQWLLVRDFFVRLMHRQFPEIPSEKFAEFADMARNHGALGRAFRRLLIEHGVAITTVDALLTAPMRFFFKDTTPMVVAANTSGKIVFLDQEKLGLVVNFELGAGGNEYGIKRDPHASIILQCHPGDVVSIWQPLCQVVGLEKRSPSPVLEERIRSCFHIK